MIRSLLEGLCARWATEHITKEQMEEMEENVYLSKFHAQKGHLEQLAKGTFSIRDASCATS